MATSEVIQTAQRYLIDNPGVGLRQRCSPGSTVVWKIVGAYLLVVSPLVLGAPDLFPMSLPRIWEVVVLPPLLVLYPSLVEEVVFRGTLLPRSLLGASALRRFSAVTASTAIFTAYHPINHYVIGLTETSLFVEPVFLAIVIALGYACGYAYLRTGSLWAPIAIHWATTVVWNLFLGR